MRTCDGLSQLGFAVRYDHLPLVFSPGEDVMLRPLRELESRAAILNIVQARVFDMPPPMAMRWLLDAHVLEELTPQEWQFIASGRGDARRYSEQLESLYALAWLLGLVPHLDPSSYCTDSLPTLMPDLRTAEPFTAWRARTLPSRRDARDVAEMLDLYCCLDWLCAESRQHGVRPPTALDESVIWHRRWALEWAVMTSRNGRPIATSWER
ncbi:DUF4272 domain-containing protein [Stackebrandtia soli]|uniref:DUF4272 domain-containing protein n=1 Tax=Stackebrandtia soli TaxID=1892856 RepID=UPI0039EB7C34